MGNGTNDRIQQLFLDALEISADERDAWLVDQCGDDARLLNEVRLLLLHDNPRQDPLEAGIERAIADVLPETDSIHSNFGENDETLCSTGKLSVSTEDFFNRLEKLGQLSNQEVSRLRDQSASDPSMKSAEQLASHLVDSSRLTRYQAQQLIEEGEMKLRLGNYTILDELGRGGMGQVFLARHIRMRRQVALKILPPEAVESPEMLERFEREIEAAAKLSHPNVVVAHDADEADDVHFLVMEYVSGQDLGSLVKREGPLSAPEAVGILVQAARGLSAAHEAGIIHRDVKPSNLIWDGNGMLKVVDFGLARLQSTTRDHYTKTRAQLTQTSTLLGTVDFLAPEQARNIKNADHRADIYSLGCTLFFLLAGKPMYPGTSMMEKLSAHQKKPIPSLSAADGPVSADLDKVFQRMVAKQPRNRFASMDDVIEALLPFADAGETTADISRTKKIAKLNSGKLNSKTVGYFRSRAVQLAVLGVVGVGIAGFVTWMLMTTSGTRPSPDSGRSISNVAGGKDSRKVAENPTQRETNEASNNQGGALDPVVKQLQGGVDHKPSALAEMYRSGQWEWTAPVNLGPVINCPNWDSDPVLSGDDLSLTYGRGGKTMFISRRNSLSETWETPTTIEIEGSAKISRGNLILDGRTIIYSAGEKRGEQYYSDLYQAHLVDATWSKPARLSVAHQAYEGGPYVTGDGLSLVYHSFRPNGQGSCDLWFSERTSADHDWVTPANFGAGINSTDSESGGYLSDDRCVLVFSSDRPGGLGANDLWMALRLDPGKPWETPFHLGAAINSDGSEVTACLSSDGRALYFSSDRPGGEGQMDIWMSRLDRKTEPRDSDSR